MKDLRSGSLCLVEWPFVATYVTNGWTKDHIIQPGEVFLLLDTLEINEIGVLEIQILFENKQMWFNIHENKFIIDTVRRAASYDIPFMALKENELGSN